MELEQCKSALMGINPQMRVAESEAASVNDTDDAAQVAQAERLARALESYRAGKYIPIQLRRALEQGGHGVSSPDSCSRTKHRASHLPGRLTEKTLSQHSETSTCSGDSEGGWSSASSVVARTVRFSFPADIVEVSRFALAEVVGSRELGTCWSDIASRRQDRFRIRVHSVRLCRQRACCHSSGGLCSGGGSLASEVALGLADVFGAWRISRGIPATVALQVMNRGRCWPRG